MTFLFRINYDVSPHRNLRTMPDWHSTTAVTFLTISRNEKLYSRSQSTSTKRASERATTSSNFLEWPMPCRSPIRSCFSHTLLDLISQSVSQSVSQSEVSAAKPAFKQRLPASTLWRSISGRSGRIALIAAKNTLVFPLFFPSRSFRTISRSTACSIRHAKRENEWAGTEERGV